MSNLYRLLTISTLFALLTISPESKAQRQRDGAAIAVSMIKILANPDFYNNKKVVITGFLHCKFEDSSIFFSKEHADYLMNSNAFWVTYDSTSTSSLKPVEFDEKYVMISGTFYSDQYGHMGSFSGTIKVDSIIKLKKWSR